MVEQAIAKLQHSAGTEWSARVLPEECAALLAHIDALQDAAQGRWDAVHRQVSAKQFLPAEQLDRIHAEAAEAAARQPLPSDGRGSVYAEFRNRASAT